MAEGIPSYDELKLRIGRSAGGGYQVVAFGPDGSTASGTLVLPFDETELDNFVLRVGRPRRGVRAYRSSQMEDAKHFGSRLFDALMAGAIRDVYSGARRAAEQNERGLRVTLYLTDVPALMEVPWEFLYDRPAFLSQSIYTPVVRSLDLKTVRPPRKLTLPLRILGMVSGPRGFETLEVGREQAKLAQALGPLEREGKVELRWLERATLSALDNAISAPDEVHIVHYIGHGAYDRRTEGGILVLENATGDPHEVTGEELGSLLQDERSLRLVVLNSCEGARGSHVDPFSGVASSLVECGIPAVVGMQFEVTDEAAITFGGRLYSALAQGFPIDAALAQSRKAIFAAGHDIEFGTPVLFLRAADARLFDPELPAGEPRSTPPSPEAGAPVHVLNPDNVGADATAEESDELDVAATKRDAVAIVGADRATDPDLLETVDTPRADRPPIDRERAQADGGDRETSRAERRPEADSPAGDRSSRRRPRVWMLVLAGGALAAVLAALLTSGSASHHNSPTASTGSTALNPKVRWQQLQPLPDPVAAAGVATYQGEVWLVGGTRGPKREPVTDVWVYRPGSNAGWVAGPPLPFARGHAAVVAAGKRLYVIGGFDPEGQAVATVFRLDGPAQKKWTRDAHSLPGARTFGAAAWDGKRIVFAGGNVDGVPQPDVWALGSQGWTPIHDLGLARDQLAAASNGNGTVWFIGGGLFKGGEAFRFVDVVQGSSVRPGTPLQVGVKRMAAVGLGHGFCAIGGHLQGAGNPASPGYAAGFTGQVQCQGVGHPLPPSARPRADSGATVLDGRIYVIGGYDPNQPFGTTTVQALDIRGAG